jgi:hypothetical protein
MVNKLSNSYMSSRYALVTLLTSTVTFGYFQGASSVFGTTTTILFPSQTLTTYKEHVIEYDKEKTCADDQHTPTTWKTYLTHFACGHVTIFNNGTTLRQFTLIVDDNQGMGHNISITRQGLLFPAWTFNGTVPGPTLRMTQGDHVRVTVINSKSSMHPHSWHVHSIHSGTMDGVMGLAGMIWPGAAFTYDFIAQPYGVYPYHCHMAPVEEHINRGLYGMMIIDPVYADKRPHATEMVMLMNGYSFNNAYNPNPYGQCYDKKLYSK